MPLSSADAVPLKLGKIETYAEAISAKAIHLRVKIRHMTTVKGHLGSVGFDGATVRVEKKLRGAQAIPLGSLGAVSIENAGIGMRAIRFAVAGGTMAGQSVALGSHKDLANDPFALTFKKKALPEFEALVNEINAARIN
jgi:hypothetical protein